jgi:hypothetical protein
MRVALGAGCAGLCVNVSRECSAGAFRGFLGVGLAAVGFVICGPFYVSLPRNSARLASAAVRPDGRAVERLSFGLALAQRTPGELEQVLRGGGRAWREARGVYTAAGVSELALAVVLLVSAECWGRPASVVLGSVFAERTG